MLMALTIAGCATTPGVNWQARIGNYTYDQAVKDYGPPDKSEKLSDDSRVADWLVREGHTEVTTEPYFFPGPGYYRSPAPVYQQTYVPSYYMELIFGPDGKLTSYKNFSR